MRTEADEINIYKIFKLTTYFFYKNILIIKLGLYIYFLYDVNNIVFITLLKNDIILYCIHNYNIYI